MSSFVKRLFGKGKEEGTPRRVGIVDNLSRAGIKVAIDDQLENFRLRALAESYKDMKQDPTMENIQDQDRLVDMIASPWGAGGENERFFRGLVSWKRLYGMYKSLFQVQGTDFSDPSNPKIIEGYRPEKDPLIRMVVSKHLIPYSHTIINASYREKHVTPNEPLVIQSAFMTTPGRTLPDGIPPIKPREE